MSTIIAQDEKKQYNSDAITELIGEQDIREGWNGNDGVDKWDEYHRNKAILARTRVHSWYTRG